MNHCNPCYGGPGPNIVIVQWGNIRGSFTSQVDLWNFLGTKANISSLAAVAFSGDYLDLKNKPNIGQLTLQQVTDNGNITTDEIIIGGLIVNGTGSFSGLVSGIPGVNPFDFATVSQLSSGISLSTTGITGAATFINDVLNIPIYQGEITLTTSGTTGASTLVGNTLNIPNYAAPSGYTLPPATYTTLGGVIVGSNLWVNSSGLLNLQGSGVTEALGYTPYNVTNPAGYITGITAVMIDNALGYTPLDPSGTSAQYFAGNGQLFTFPTLPTPGGSNTDIQFNNSGGFGGSGDLTWSGTLFYVSGSTQITSLASTGTTMVVASSTGLLSTRSLPTSTLPGGSNTDIQFNSSGSFAGSNNLTWNGSLFFVSGTTQISSLASTGTTMVVASSSGLLSTQSIPVNAISSVSNSDGSLTISPTTGVVVASLNVAHANTWTAVQTHQDNGLGATTIPFISLINNTPASSGTTAQVSPALIMQGQGWKSTATAASQSVAFQQYVQPVTGAAAPTGQWLLQSSISGSTAVTILTANSNAVSAIFSSTGLGLVVASGTYGFNFQNSGGTITAGLQVTGSSGEIRHVANTGGYFQTFYANNVEAMRINTSQHLLIGTTTDTGAFLNLAASTATVASLNIATGTAPTSPVVGDMWITGGHLFVCLTAGVATQIV